MDGKTDDEPRREGQWREVEGKNTEGSLAKSRATDDKSGPDSQGPGKTMNKNDPTDSLGMDKPMDESASTDALRSGEVRDADDVVDEELEMMLGHSSSNPCPESSTSPSSSKDIGQAKSQDPIGQGSIYMQMFRDSIGDGDSLLEISRQAMKFVKMESEAMSWDELAAIYPWMRRLGPPGPGIPPHEAMEFLEEHYQAMNESDSENEDGSSLRQNDNLKTLRENKSCEE